MQHKCKVTVIDKKLYPELQQQYCMDKESGPCPCYQIGDEFVFERYGAAGSKRRKPAWSGKKRQNRRERGVFLD